MGFWTIFGAWVAVALTFGLYSFLYKDNPVFKVCEHVYLGAGMGYLLVSVFFTVVQPKLVEPLWYQVQTDVFRKSDAETSKYLSLKKETSTPEELKIAFDGFKQSSSWLLLIPAFLSAFMLFRFIPKTAWLSRISFAFIIGYYAGINIPASASADLFSQLKVSLKPLWENPGPGISFWHGIDVNRILILIGVLSTLIYFFFSLEHKGVVRGIAKVGVVYLMISFGAAFGYTVMARESLLIGRVQELLDYSTIEYYHATPIVLQLMIGLLIFLGAREATRKSSGASPEA